MPVLGCRASSWCNASKPTSYTVASAQLVVVVLLASACVAPPYFPLARKCVVPNCSNAWHDVSLVPPCRPLLHQLSEGSADEGLCAECLPRHCQPAVPGSAVGPHHRAGEGLVRQQEDPRPEESHHLPKLPPLLGGAGRLHASQVLGSTRALGCRNWAAEHVRLTVLCQLCCPRWKEAACRPSFILRVVHFTSARRSVVRRDCEGSHFRNSAERR